MARRDEIIGFCDELLASAEFDDYAPTGLQVPGAEEVTRGKGGIHFVAAGDYATVPNPI